MCHRAARIFKSPTHKMAIYFLSLQSLSLTVCTSSHPSAGRSPLRKLCKFVLKHTSSFSNIICEFSNIFPSSLASSWLAGWRRVSARGKWVDTFPNYSPPEDLCYPPTNKLTKFSSPAHATATHCAPAALPRPCVHHYQQW